MKSISEYQKFHNVHSVHNQNNKGHPGYSTHSKLSDNKSNCISCNNQQIQEEITTAGILTVSAISLILSVIITLGMYFFTILSIRKDINNAKLDEYYTDKLKRILNDDTVECYILNSKELEAFNVGSNKCYMTSGLISFLNSEKEIISIYLHEYGHFKKKHNLRILGMEMTVGISIGLFIAIYTYITKLIWPILIVLSVIGFLLRLKITDFLYLIQNKKFEYEADDFARSYNYGTHLAKALKKLDVYHKKIHQDLFCKNVPKKQCDELYVQLVRSISEHPETSSRITKLLRKPEILRFAMKMMAARIKNRISSIQMISYLKHYVNRLNSRGEYG